VILLAAARKDSGSSSESRRETYRTAAHLAMFNLAIDSKLRGCDVGALRDEDVAAGRYTADRAMVR
jgi:hypothetical protein